MKYAIARGLQLVGMAFLPVALYLGLVKDDVRREVILLAAGGALFLVGWLLQQRGR